MLVFIISQNQINLDSFLAVSNQVLGKSLSSQLDQQRIDPKTLPAYISILGEMRKPGYRPGEQLVNAGKLLDHIYLTFGLVSLKRTCDELIQESRLVVTTTEAKEEPLVFSVISGTLSDWKDMIMRCSTDWTYPQLRKFANKIQSELEANGFRDLFTTSRKVPLTDQTFKLVGTQ